MWVPCECAGVPLHFGSLHHLGLQAREVEVEDMHTGESVELKTTGDQKATMTKLTNQEAMAEIENRGTENTVNFRVKPKHKTQLGTRDRHSKSPDIIPKAMGHFTVLHVISADYVLQVSY